MSVEEALDPDNLLAYEMNGAPLPPAHGSPVRLIAPGWYGVANVKWLTRIDVVDQRHAGRFMARDYVTIREPKAGAQTVWTFSNVSHMRLKSAPAKVTRRRDRYTIMGAAWGAPVSRVEVRIDDGPWLEADARPPGRPPSRARDVRLVVLDAAVAQAGLGRALASRHGPSTSRATSNHRRRIRTSRAGSPTGRTTARSPAAS